VTWIQEPCDLCACSEGSGLSPNLVVNGSFSQGDVAFTTQLNPNSPCSGGSYAVGTDFPVQCNTWPTGVFDHTTGTGNFLIIDGAPSVATTIWSQQVNVIPGMTYCFSYWTASVYCDNQQYFDLEVMITDSPNQPGTIGTHNIMEACPSGQPFVPTWIHHSLTWTCPLNFSSPCILQINQFSGLFGDAYTDFGLDDICFTQTCACPAGSVAGIELVNNGDFEQGNVNFSSDYGPLLVIPGCSPKLYTVTDAASVGNFCNDWACANHTGFPSGKFFVADGSQQLGDAAWRQQIPINPSSQYSFCAWVNNLYTPSYNGDDPIVEVYIVDNSGLPHFLQTTGPLPESPDDWINILATWISPSAASFDPPYELQFRTSSTAFDGNNFALDDISFMECSKTPVDSCCTDYDLFCQNMMNAVSVSVDNNQCKVRLSFGSLPCDDYIEWVNWGDGSIDFGNFYPGAMPMHIYSGSGTYVISYLAIELDPVTGLICFEKVLTNTVTAVCRTCDCPDNIVQNPGFFEGAIPGSLGGNGSTNNWTAASGTPDLSANIPDCDPFGQSGRQYHHRIRRRNRSEYDRL
jgi:hypothetical protein